MGTENTSTPADGGLASTSGQAQAATSNGLAPNESSNLTPEEAQQIIKQLRKENGDFRSKAKKQEEAQLLAEQQRLAEQGQFKQLAEQAQAEAQRLQTQLEAMQQEMLRTRIAAKHGLPEALASRLQGSTEEEMTADALELKKFINQKVEVSVQPGNAPNPKPAGQATPQQTLDALKQQMNRQRGRLI